MAEAKAAAFKDGGVSDIRNEAKLIEANLVAVFSKTDAKREAFINERAISLKMAACIAAETNLNATASTGKAVFAAIEEVSSQDVGSDNTNEAKLNATESTANARTAAYAENSR